MSKSSIAAKPRKPHPDFPLFPHATRRWAKKVRGKLHYFGPWDDPDGALARWLEQKDDLLAGRVARRSGDLLTVRDAVNRFLSAKRHLVDTRELSERTFIDHHDVCGRIIKVLGLTRTVADLRPEDFARLRASFAKTRGLVCVANDITRTRMLFKFCWDNRLIPAPVDFGTEFKKPTQKALRRQRNENGEKLLEADQVRALVAAADQPLKAMILLGINCGYGNADVGLLPIRVIDFDAGWINYPRPKTQVARRSPLWPETIEALQDAIRKRPKPKDEGDGGLAFITSKGLRWHKDTQDNPVAKEFVKLAKRLGYHRRGIGFYVLRHTHETIGGETRDQVAVDAMMGHAPATSDMSARYRERISDDRLLAVSNHVRKWYLSGNPKKKATTKARAKSKAP
jgi:integrase